MVVQATIRQDVFAAVSALIIANKPQYTHNGTTYTYTMVSEYPENDSVFPCIVLNKSAIKLPAITMNAETFEPEIEIPMDFYAIAGHGKKAIDIAQDSLMNTFIGNISSFIATNKLIPQDDFWQDSGSTTFEDNNQILHNATSTVRFKL